MHISLIGMSNIGKSHWANRLSGERGYERIHCDHLIEQRLGEELTKHGYRGEEGMAKWLGQPYDAQYPKTSLRYIELERSVMQGVIEKLRSTGKDRPLIIDTTGSVIYTGDEVINSLRSLSRVVFLEASRAHVAALFARYTTDPKPLIWNDSFRPLPGEVSQATLERCYPALLEDRAARYKKMAHVTIPFEQHKNPDAGVGIFAGQAA